MTDWRDNIKVGDVLLTRAGKPRVVRKVYYRNGHCQSVTLTIKRCSWTGRCYTVVNRHDLKYGGYSKSNVRITSMTRMDKRIMACILNASYRKLDCCDVKGVA